MQVWQATSRHWAGPRSEQRQLTAAQGGESTKKAVGRRNASGQIAFYVIFFTDHSFDVFCSVF
jgi:hypothetical protein